ncbi:MAG: hypothetical protein D6800_14415 [Candidatus Zixiibacteriota bacterium]|nr:MAG: hypothetical protein D6800_14415 [candidate division Zixibacteria bacterium]
MRRLRLVTRVGLFAALVYVLSWASSALPNITPAFFVTFAAGYLWGALPGVLVGAIGMALWTVFNPYGPAALPIALAQVIGLALNGPTGALFRRRDFITGGKTRRFTAAAVAGLLCTLFFYLPVNVTDAWLFQPFWPRFWVSTAASGISALFNLIVFPLLFPAVEYLYARESLRP